MFRHMMFGLQLQFSASTLRGPNATLPRYDPTSDAKRPGIEKPWNKGCSTKTRPGKTSHLARGGRSGCFWRRARGAPHADALARQTAMYLAHVACTMKLTQVGEMFDRDRTTVAHACTVIENRRDDVNFDRAMALLEEVVCGLLHPDAPRSRISPEREPRRTTN